MYVHVSSVCFLCYVHVKLYMYTYNITLLYFHVVYLCSSKEGIEGASRRHHLHHLPPVTPSECIRDTVISILFDQLWSEVHVHTCMY